VRDSCAQRSRYRTRIVLLVALMFHLSYCGLKAPVLPAQTEVYCPPRLSWVRGVFQSLLTDNLAFCLCKDLNQTF
jgi:hypothetical protein